MRSIVFIVAIACNVACNQEHSPEAAQPTVITVAAAANLTDAFEEIRKAFSPKTGIEIVYSYGSTTLLSEQIRNAAPFDVFAAADTEHVDALVSEGKILADSRDIYARGLLALWIPPNSNVEINGLRDLTKPEVRLVAIAKPEAAPYGQAAVEALMKTGIWRQVQPKVVYGGNVNMAKQYAASNNVDAAFTAYSLVFRESGKVIEVDPSLHEPIDQALGILASSSKQAAARRFIEFILSEEGQGILKEFGYRM